MRAALALFAAVFLVAAAPIPKLAPDIQRGLELRTRLGFENPVSDPVVYIYSGGGHYTFNQFARVAWRGADGRWTVSGAGEESPRLINIEPRLIPEQRRVLTEADGQALDRLLDRSALYRQRAPRNRPVPPPGTIFNTMEIVSPRGHLVISWDGRLKGRAGEVADLLMGRAG